MRGSCLCERVVVSVERIEPRGMKCYCTICRKVSGSAFAAVVLTRPGWWSIERGHDELACYESTPGNERRHCRTCLSHVYTEARDRPDVPVFVSAALFEPAEIASVRFEHIFVKSLPPWHEIADDDAPRFREYPQRP